MNQKGSLNRFKNEEIGMDWVGRIKSRCPQKMVDAEVAISKIRNGSRVFVGSACGEPQHLIRTMVGAKSIKDIMIYQMLSHTFSEYVEQIFQTKYCVRV